MALGTAVLLIGLLFLAWLSPGFRLILVLVIVVVVGGGALLLFGSGHEDRGCANDKKCEEFERLGVPPAYPQCLWYGSCPKR